MRPWLKDGNYWRQELHQWQIGVYGITGQAPFLTKGDLIYDTLSKIIDDNDKSLWAYEALSACAQLLFERKRWPDRMNQSHDAPNRLVERLSKLAKWLYLRKTILGRPQKDITRDPFLALYCCCMHLGVYQFIEIVTIPIRLYIPTVWIWKRRLIKDNRRNFVKRLGYYMAKATILKYEKE